MDKMDIMDKMDMMQPAPARRAKTLRSTAIALALTLVVFHSACREKKDFFTADETWFPGEATPAPTPAAETVPRDVPSIARVLESPSESRRADAARALGGEGLAARDALPALVLLANEVDEKADVRIAAIRAMGKIGPWDDGVVPSLVANLGDKDDAVAGASAQALGDLGPAAASAVDPLTDTLARPAIRNASADALARIGGPAVDALAKAEQSPDPLIRETARRALAEVGEPAVMAHIARLSRQDTREDAIGALAKIGAPAVAELAAALSHKDEDVRRAAAEALRRVGPAAQPASEKLVAATDDYVPAVRASAQSAFAAIGPATRAEVRAVVWGLRDGNPMVHEAAARAARAIDPNLPADARAELVAALSDHRGPVRAEVAAALGRVGGRAAVDPLIVRLSDSDERVRLSATHALGLLGADAITARDALKERLSDPDPKVREAAARAIARIDTAVR